MVDTITIPELSVQDGPGYVFTGDPDEEVTITAGGILAGLLPVCSPQYQYFQNVVGANWQPWTTTKGNVIAQSGAQISAMMQGFFTVTGPSVFTYFAIAQLQDDFSVSTDPNDPNAYFYWSFSGTHYVFNGLTFACDPLQGYQAWTTEPATGGYFGTKPIISEIATLPQILCPLAPYRYIRFQGSPILFVQMFGPTLYQNPTMTDAPIKQMALQFFQQTDIGPAMPLPGIPDGYPMPAPLAGVPNPCDSQGPPGEQGPPGDCSGCLTDFADVVTSSGASGLPDSLFQLFAENVNLVGPLNADNLTTTVVAMDPSSLQDMCEYLVNEETDTFFPEPVLICSNTEPSQIVTVNEGDGPVYQATLPCAPQGGEMGLDWVAIQTDACGQSGALPNDEIDGSFSTAMLTYTDPSTGHTYTQAALFDAIISKLDYLLKCCPPCDFGPIYQETVEVSVDRADNQAFGSFSAPGPNYPMNIGVDEVVVNAISTMTAIDTTLAPPDVGKYGRFWFTTDCGEQLPVQFINLNNQKFQAPGANIGGFGYHLNYGVSLTFNVKTSVRPLFGQW